jgi:hypothetical protein
MGTPMPANDPKPAVINVGFAEAIENECNVRGLLRLC